MKNKKQIAFLSVILASTMIMAACGGKPSNNSNSSNSASDSSSETTSSSDAPVVKHTATFVANGQTVYSVEVVEGECAEFVGAEPTKAADANAFKYGFRGWDKDPAETPITEDTTFTAQFQPYVQEAMIDDFEAYEEKGDLVDAGWHALGYDNGSKEWVKDTKAAVTLGTKSVEGQKSLRFDAWENGVGYKFAKAFAEGAFPKSANALKFRLMVPSINTVKVMLYANATVINDQGQEEEMEPEFAYTINPISGEYVDYVIPLDDDGWALWGDAEKTIKSVAAWTGFHQDDILQHLTKLEFYIEGNDHGSYQPYAAFLDSIRFVTLDAPVKSEEETMGTYNKYTGYLADGHTIKIEIGANNAASATILDTQQPQTINGTVAVDGKEITFTSADNGVTLVYKGKMVNGGQKIQFVSATGAYAEGAQGMSLTAVQVVDNFESYTEDGQAYYQGDGHGKADRKGCRGAYYSEYYAGSGSTDWGGNGWSLLGGSGDQLKLKADSGAHSGGKYLCVKHSKSFGFRYMQWGLYDGTSEKNAYRGSKFGFWAKTNGYVESFTVSLYSQSKPTNATKDQYVKKITVGPDAAIGQWTHYETDIDESVVYYGYMIFTEKNTFLQDSEGQSSGQSFLYIDDVEVYGASPYATYVAPANLQANQVFCGKVQGIAPATLAIGSGNTASLSIPAMNAQFAGTYTMDNRKATFDFGAYGTIEATLNDKANKLTLGNPTGALVDLDKVVLDEVTILDNAESYTSSGTMFYQSNKYKTNRSGARGAYYCDYNEGNQNNTSPVGGKGWNLMGGSGDQLSLQTKTDNANLVHSGENSLKLKRNKTNAMRYMTWGLVNGTAKGYKGYNYFMYFVKNPNSVALTLKTSVYYQAKVTSDTQQSNRAYVEASIPANSDWTPVIIPLDAGKTYYGVSYVPATVSGGGSADYCYVDDAMFYSEEMNLAAPITVKKGLVLSGNITPGAASITFDLLGKATLKCAAANLEKAVTFSIVGQTMTINVPALSSQGTASKITGTYSVSQTEQDKVEFKVTAVTGDLAQYVPVNTVFAGSIA